MLKLWQSIYKHKQAKILASFSHFQKLRNEHLSSKNDDIDEEYIQIMHTQAQQEDENHSLSGVELAASYINQFYQEKGVQGVPKFNA